MTGQWAFYQFGLIVTGETEEQCLPDLFRVLAARGNCSFKVIRRVGQRSPRGVKRQQKMVGTGKVIPDRDAEEIGLPARRFLAESDCNYVVLVDDLEADRAANVQGVFDRYRSALDTMLLESAPRAAVHFLVNMLEAYYFADAMAVNRVLGTSFEDVREDAEAMRHPKRRMKTQCPSFDEKHHGPRIVAELDVLHILACTNTCASLRTMFAWASEAIGSPEWLPPGQMLDTTKGQIDALRAFRDTQIAQADELRGDVPWIRVRPGPWHTDAAAVR